MTPDEFRRIFLKFVTVADAYDRGLLLKARPEWSDVEGDQDGVPLLHDKNGAVLLTLKDFLDVREALRVENC